MPDYYMLTRASITMDYITAHRARELYVDAESEPEAGLHGDLETGFYFWAFDTESGLKLIHYRVIPVPTDEVPEDVRDRLHDRPDAPPGATPSAPATAPPGTPSAAPADEPPDVPPNAPDVPNSP